MKEEMDLRLRQLQQTELDILKLIDGICRRNGIRYSLYFGTMLGAARHGGFIPWDDDLDVCMSRPEYERFLRVWEEERPAGYLLQNKENTPGFTQTFTKIRKEHTCFVQFEWEKGRYHTGIFVDIFPLDRTPEGGLARKLFLWDGMIYQLFTREFVPPKGSRLQKTVSRVLLALVPKGLRASLRARKLKRIRRYEDRKDLPRVGLQTLHGLRHPLPADLLEEFTEIPFEDGTFPCFAGWKTYLERAYRAPWQLPPEEKRVWTHHPIVLDFRRDWEEISRDEAGSDVL